MSPRLAADTKVFQDMADAMLPHFDNMPQVVVLVEDHEVFTRDPFPAAVYSHPNIIINPSHARTCSYDEIQGTICHELIHAWLQWKGLVGTGEHLDDHHNELFVKKALEVNQKDIDSLNVDVDYLLATPKAVDIYNRVAGIRFAPYLRHKVRRIWKIVAANTKQLDQTFELTAPDRLLRVASISFLIPLISSVLNKVHLIPDAVASFVWWGWPVAIFLTYVLMKILQRTR